ncbi:Uncharacterised protein [Cedecea neteri]|uniref:Uncharacterized protein n=1 Tax=Cedecea neteri TaxID=158822 RepID=A0A2X2T106_9ENTR|nr:Uncharacterised protein [Cedecea neteri]
MRIIQSPGKYIQGPDVLSTLNNYNPSAWFTLAYSG